MKKTPLHSSHTALGAKMGEFAGYDMPLYYPAGVLAEHEWVRTAAGLFDVSHMGQVMVKGPGALDLVHRLTPTAFGNLPVGRAKYTVLMNDAGGMIDDLIITHAMDDAYHMVLNAGRKDVDMAWIRQNLTPDLKFMVFDEWALMALQGPRAEEAAQDILELDLSAMPYMGMRAEGNNTLFISRLGYTGEDGFEIAVRQEEAPALWDRFLAHPAVKPIGLAARDSLRLEMGYPLYGHDIDETTSPIEADLGWIVGKAQRSYIGHGRVVRDLASGTARTRVGIRIKDKGVAREGAEIRDGSDRKIGHLTSGGFSPTLKESIGQGYIETGFVSVGTPVFVHVRGRNLAAEIARMPFVPARTKALKRAA